MFEFSDIKDMKKENANMSIFNISSSTNCQGIGN